ncbi:universal stress protein [Nonomuraea sediminis]|uniref:universal stress protein n=1 Tax=Nonomuraea sediminis TaxID=2835864 RepID=UPI001BDD43DF|nr:universal stress protein [Nonomuraea sediminis]
MILAGVDGSHAAREAAAWAAREAGLRGADLTVAYAMPRWACETDSGRYSEVAAWMRQSATEVLEAAAERARQERPEVSLTSRYLPGDPRTALIRAAADAELLVVGNHGVGGVRGLLIGSVAYGVAGHAPCPVVVVRGLPREARNEVVVGVSGNVAALEFAFAEAALRDARLLAVHVRAEDEPPDALKLLAESRERHLGVAVVEQVVDGDPATVLREAGTGAELLVVGSRGHGAVAGMVLGSVSQALLHHASCPLAVVGPSEAGR